MNLTGYLYQKINDEMRMIYITPNKPKLQIRLDPLDPEDLNVNLQVVERWSQDNPQLYRLLLENGMAQFICNRQFLNEFYTNLQFMYSGISSIDSDSTKLSNLKVLNLFHNNISTIENIPPSCNELYLDFNQVNQVGLKSGKSNIELLSLSHNLVSDSVLAKICKEMPQLRCLNVSYNRLEDIRQTVTSIKKCSKLKMLATMNNPISMLAIYWTYITNQIALDYFDNEKYVKPEPPKPKEKVAEVKEEKKQTKKEAKKGGKVEEKPPEPEPEPEPIKEEPKVLTEEDYTISKITYQVGIMENVIGVINDASLFPADTEPAATQSCFWVQLDYLGHHYSSYDKKIALESATVDGDTSRLNFDLSLCENVSVSNESLSKFNEGVRVFVWKEEPVVETDGQSGEQKVVMQQDKVKMKIQCVGGCFLKAEKLHKEMKKEIKKNFNLFSPKAAQSPLFQRSHEKEEEMIKKNRIQFDAQLAQQEQQRRKKAEEEEAAKAQKKGGKDSKKAADKKGAKKDSKEPADKKTVNRSEWKADEKQYVWLGEGKMFKCLGQSLQVRLAIE